MCRIECWHGYVTSRFFALTDDGQVLESTSFRCWQAGPPPETMRARAAYREFVARLEAEGWTSLEDSGPWFATIFARTVLRPVPAADPLQSERVHFPVAVARLLGHEETTQLSQPEPGTKAEAEAEAAIEFEPDQEPEPEQEPKATAAAESERPHSHSVTPPRDASNDVEARVSRT